MVTVLISTTAAEGGSGGDSPSGKVRDQWEGSSGQGRSPARQEKEGKYAALDTADLHSLLHKVDPESAERLHPKNRRKIVR